MSAEGPDQQSTNVKWWPHLSSWPRMFLLLLTIAAYVLPPVTSWTPSSDLTHYAFRHGQQHADRSIRKQNRSSTSRRRAPPLLAVNKNTLDTSAVSSSTSSNAKSDTGTTSSATGTANASEDSQLRTLYPPINATRNGTLQVDSTHALYYEHYGLDLPSNEGDDDDSRTKSAQTALFLHGGPGAGCSPNHARFFSPEHYSIVLFDQRGCGRSTPKGETSNNTLTHLVEDIEALRVHLGIGKWDLLLGGSWGTALALAYAQTCPGRVGAMVLRGVCLFRPQEIDWLFASNGGAANRLNPNGWKEFESVVGINASHESINSEDGESNREALHRYYNCLIGSNPTQRVLAMKAWMKWEMSIFGYNQSNANDTTTFRDSDEAMPPLLVWDGTIGMWSFQDEFGPVDEGQTDQLAAKRANSLRQFSMTLAESAVTEPTNGAIPESPRPVDANTQPILNAVLPPNVTADQAAKFIPAQAMLTCYYSVNDRLVMSPYNNLLAPECIDQIRDIPCIAIQGGQDTICPPDTALDLLEAWPEMELRIPLRSGHSMYNPEICSEILKATDRLAGIEL